MQEKHPIVFRDAYLDRALLFDHLRRRAAECPGHQRAFPAGLQRSVRTLRRSLRFLMGYRRQQDESLLTPAALWLCDNARLLEEMCLSVQEELENAPRLPAMGRIPCIQILLRECLAHSDAQLDASSLYQAAEAWQQTRALTEDELALLPLLARRALLQLLSHLSKECVWVLKERSRARLSPSPSSVSSSGAYWESLITYYQEQQDGDMLQKIDERLFSLGASSAEIVSLFHDQQSRDRLWVGNAIASLRALSSMQWRPFHEKLSVIEHIYSSDPVYPQMTPETRARYRRRTALLARRFHLPEKAAALRCAEMAKNQTDPLLGHVGYYLVDAGEEEYLPRLGAGKMHVALRRAGRLCAGSIYVISCGLLFILSLLLLLRFAPSLPLLALLPALPLVHDGFLQLLHFLLLRLLPARPLPALSAEAVKGRRILVVVPTLLTSPQQALEMTRRLSVLRFANPQSNLSYLLLSDFMDSKNPTEPEDEAITNNALDAVSALNQVWGGGFYYLHRKRSENKREKKFMGYERKRGALEALNHLIQTGTLSSPAICSFDPASFKDAFSIVITLDADTQLPPGAALSLAGILCHPLNVPCVHQGKSRGFAVIQPRMETAPFTVHTRIARFFGGGDGVDPYLCAFGDVYQNLCSRGSFAGKGAYHVGAFSHALEGKIQENTILSHDLLEGEISRSAQACDLPLFDSQPAALQGWLRRQHRWVRGDWQLLPWLFPYVHGKEESFRNPLSLLSRHKIFDNLRRSLLPVFSLFSIFASALLHLPSLFVLSLLLPHLSVFLSPSLASLRCAFFHLAVLPLEAFRNLDAISRTLYRLLVSRRHLLQWLPSEEAEKIRTDSPRRFFPAYVCALALLVFALSSSSFFALPISLLFLFIAPIENYLNGPLEKKEELSFSQKDFLLDAARRTFRFFEETVTPATNFLPPDNLQLDPPRGAALRTSPTNIGLYLLSCAAAARLSILTPDEAARRMQRTAETLLRMEKWKGHLYNWYHIASLEVLPPRYVSSVDSGNLAACLTLCAQLLRQDLEKIDPSLHSLPQTLDELSNAMDFSALYDEEKELFFIGLQPENGEGRASHYDLLASESRLLSFLAITRRDVPARHWQRLGRSMSKNGGGVLLSWSGTLFEYLLPALFLPHAPSTLLGDSCKRAALIQMRFSKDYWGVSESGYYAFDLDLSYQYRAFGLPALSLSSQKEEKVISPYAAALALPFFPGQACENLRRMAQNGWWDALGFYEAADFSPERLPAHCPYRLVRSHMAHHQGMILSSICNLLTDGALVKAFSSLPQTQAFSLLLQERCPARRMLRRACRLRPLPPASLQPSMLRRADPTLFPAQVHLLGSHGSTLLFTARGSSFFACRQWMLTRWRGGEMYPCGFQLYAKIGEDAPRRLFSPREAGDILFDRGCVIVRRDLSGIKIEATLFVSPLDGAFITLVRLYSPDSSRLALSGFSELCLTTQSAWEAHPVFQSLGVQTASSAPGLITARRRSSKEGEIHPLFFSGMAVDASNPVFLETSRSAYLGRESSAFEQPDALSKEPADGRLGDVLDPCAAHTAFFTLDAGQSACCVFVSGLCQEESDALSILEKCRSISEAQRLLEMAQTQYDVSLRYHQITPPLLLCAHHLAAHLIFPASRPLPAGAFRSDFWPLGVSGDLPVVCAVIREESHLPLARDLLRLHAYITHLGISFDLVIVNTQSSGYRRPVHDALMAYLHGGPSRTLINLSGGVHVIEEEQSIPAVLKDYACLYLDGKEGSLHTQLRAMERKIPCPQENLLQPASPMEEIDASSLALLNGFGGFESDASYRILRRPPLPWCNILSNPLGFGCVVSDQGPLSVFYPNSRLSRLTPFAADPLLWRSGQNLYLQDESSRRFSPLFPAQSCVHGLGFSRYETSVLGISASITVFVPHTETLQCMLIRLQNPAPHPRALNLTAAARFILGDGETDSRGVFCHVSRGSVIAERPGFDGFAYLSFAGRTARATCDAPAFLGCGGLDNPRGMYPDAFENEGRGEAFGALRTTVALSGGEEETICLLLGVVPAPSHLPSVLPRWAFGGAQAQLAQTQSHWHTLLSRLMIQTPHPALNLIAGKFLPYQALTSRLQARSGFYQSGGAIGFRDQLQDLLAFLYTDPALVRRHILNAAAHQFPEGDVQHWWHPPYQGVRTRIVDDRLFLPYVTALYVRASGDASILNEEIPYLISVPIPEDQEDWYGEARPSSLSEPLRLHCLRAIDSIALGAHFLPLMGSGDWNDGMNRVGEKGRGESVWMAFFLSRVLELYPSICMGEDEKEKKRSLLERRKNLLKAAQTHAWDGAWYLRAWFDDGSPLGSQQSAECQIDLLVQAWAVLSGAENGKQALLCAIDRLWDASSGILRLLDPPFNAACDPGYIRAYPPGIRENGGQYTHAAVWAVEALARCGEYQKAWEIALRLLPTSHTENEDMVLRYRGEPYVLAADVSAFENPGRAGWTWYTGSAALLYHVIVTVLLGFEKQGPRARLIPHVPEDWQEFSISFAYHSSRYIFFAKKGAKKDPGWIPLLDDGKEHPIVYPLP